jgi:hypothetical protein
LSVERVGAAVALTAGGLLRSCVGRVAAHRTAEELDGARDVVVAAAAAAILGGGAPRGVRPAPRLRLRLRLRQVVLAEVVERVSVAAIELERTVEGGDGLLAPPLRRHTATHGAGGGGGAAARSISWPAAENQSTSIGTSSPQARGKAVAWRGSAPQRPSGQPPTHMQVSHVLLSRTQYA